MYDLLWKKRKGLMLSAMAGVLTLLSFNAAAQLRDRLNLPDNDDRKYHIGIVVMGTQNRYQINHHPKFLQDDSITAVYPENSIGLGIGGMHTFRLSRRFEARVVFPQLLFVNKALTYNLKYPKSDESTVMTKNVESILLGMPVQIKFRGDRIDNFRVYMMAGFKIETDLASKAREKNAELLIKTNKFDYGIEAGIGFNIFMPYFILSPEIKISNGLGNVHSRDPDLKFSSVIDKMQSRMIVFSLIFEG